MTKAAVLEGTSHALLPATPAPCTTLQLMDVPIIPCTMIFTPHPTLTTSPTGTTHATLQTGASFTPATPTAQQGDLSPEKSSNAQYPKFPINPTALRWSPSRIALQTLHLILTVTLIIKTTRALSQ